MNKVKLILFHLILVCIIKTNSQKISETKCEENAGLVTNNRSTFPHLIEILKVDSVGSLITKCIGTLINELYVLTSAYCARYANHERELTRVRKYVFPGDRNLDNHLYKVYRYIPHHLYDDTLFIYNDIGLLHLNESIPYTGRSSDFRPACLWTNSDILDYFNYTTLAEKLYEKPDHSWDQKLVEEKIDSISNEECNKEFSESPETLPDGIIHTQICFKHNFDSDTELLSIKGSPVQAKVGENYYIVGVVTRSFRNSEYTLTVGTKINRYLKWIESIVWAKHKNVLSPTGCGERKIKHKPYLSFALPTYHGQFPWHIAIFRREMGEEKRYICGGTILSKVTILTAAHCVYSEFGLIAADRITIYAGKHDLELFSLDSVEVRVKSILVHDDYNRHYLENDIALLKLNSPLTFTNYIQPICLTDNSDYYSVSSGTVAGWGRDENNNPTTVLLQANLPIRINSECRQSNRNFFPNYLNDNNFCAGYGNGTIVCLGDSGGGFIFEHSGKFYVRGIVSLGVALPTEDRCDITELVLFTDVPKFYEWISLNLE